ncbi:MAG TPA: enoyl-CoA hydratase/isomerase family protein [Actinomycetota bacterium]|nr:enoyl-CoA hydratase/isomerase family protein [Actinomycetota bacterium]
MAYETLLLDRDGYVATVTMNRPERRNAVTPQMFAELESVFRELSADDSCRVVILTGAGGAFCSGLDLSALGGGGVPTPASFRDRMRDVNACIRAIADFPKPTIAAVEGIAAGGGCNLALICDIVVASDDARFAELFVRRGLTVDMGGTWALTRRVGLHRAKELAFTGDTVSAQEAERIGLVNRVVPKAAVLKESAELASRIAANAPVAVRMAKHGLNRASESGLEESLDLEAHAQAICSSTQDVVEGVTAFLEKREPKFQGR